MRSNNETVPSVGDIAIGVAVAVFILVFSYGITFISEVGLWVG